MTFKELGLHDDLLEALDHMNFEKATPVQEQAIPIILEGRDLIACAQTGTGKTAAFLLPTLDLISQNKKPGVKALIVCPTRELAIQIDRQVQGLAYFLGVFSIAVYGGGGGGDWDQQKKALTEGADIIVATPGKLISHLNMGYVNFKNLTHFILDEADRMMDMGFKEDIEKIASFLPKERQNLMFSATMPSKIRKLIQTIMNPNPAQVNLAMSKPAAGVLQAAYLVHDAHKSKLVAKLLEDKPNLSKIIIFTSTKDKVKEVTKALNKENYGVGAISSDFEQEEREEVLRAFKAERIRVLVGTDVISRGIDIKDINLVINYDVPRQAEDYVHRVGRTARASTTGVAITFINERDMHTFQKIEKLIEMEIVKQNIPAEIGESPIWNPNNKANYRGRDSKSGGDKNKGGNKKRHFKKKPKQYKKD